MGRFVVAADLHLGAGPDLGLAPGDRLREQEAALERIVQVANELDAPLLFAGDAWERRRPTPEEILAFRRPLEKLERGGLAIPGNHDVEAFELATGYDVFAGVTRLASRARPCVFPLGDSLIACLPWAPPGRLVALEGGGDRDDLNRRLAEGLVEIARGLFVEARELNPVAPVILLAHWSVSGASVPSGIPVELFREPVLDANALGAIGFDAVALGHIHKAQTIDTAGALEAWPGPVFYAGSPLPLNFGEAEVDHGCYLLDVSERAQASAYFVPIESRRLVTLELDFASAPGDVVVDGVTDYAADVEDAIVKVRIRATQEAARRFDVGALRANLEARGAHKVWAIQVEVERAEVVRGPAIDETIDDLEAFRLWLEASGTTISPIDGGPLPALEEELLDAHASYLEEINR